MKEYLNLRSFRNFLSTLIDDVPAVITYESTENNTSIQLPFMKLKFAGDCIILCKMPSKVIVIQDTPNRHIEDQIFEFFYYLNDSGHRIYIEYD